jgi:hypothetical protein
MAEFKKLSEVEVVETLAETANVLIEENGVIKKVSKDVVVDSNDDEGGNVGGISYQTFDFTFDDGTKLKLTAMGNDIVNVFYKFTGDTTGVSLQHVIPTDNAEFTSWAAGKVLMFSAIPIVGVGGTNAGTFFDYPALVIVDVSGSMGGGPMVMISSSGYSSDPVKVVVINETVKAMSVDEMS